MTERWVGEMRRVSSQDSVLSNDFTAEAGTGVEAEERAVNGNRKLVRHEHPNGALTDVKQKIGAIDISIDGVGDSVAPLYGSLYRVGANTVELAQTSLIDFARRRADSQGGLHLSRQERAQTLREGASRGRDTWDRQEQELANFPVGGSRAEIEDFISGVQQSANLRLSTSRSLYKDQLDAARRGGELDHQMQLREIKRFDEDVAAFSRMLKVVIEMQELAMEVIQKQWLKARMNQLKVVQDTITQVIREREARRRDAGEQLEQQNRQQQHQQDLRIRQQNTDHRLSQENKVQVHQERIDLENLNQKRVTQERADRLADRRMGLEEKMEQFKHDLEMRRVEVNKPSFWVRLGGLWF